MRRALISYFSFSITPITNSVANYDKMQIYAFNMKRCKTKQVLEKSNKEEGTGKLSNKILEIHSKLVKLVAIDFP